MSKEVGSQRLQFPVDRSRDGSVRDKIRVSASPLTGEDGERMVEFEGSCHFFRVYVVDRRVMFR